MGIFKKKPPPPPPEKNKKKAKADAERDMAKEGFKLSKRTTCPHPRNRNRQQYTRITATTYLKTWCDDCGALLDMVLYEP